jgi:hypothetical protein
MVPSSIATPAPTVTVVPRKPTPRPQMVPKGPILTGATFGGTREAFAQVYGPPADADLWDIHGVTFSLNLDTGADGRPHVFGMLVYKSDATAWTQPDAERACTPFLPPDAHKVGTAIGGDGVSPEITYTSAGFASTFAPDSPEHSDDGALVLTYTVRDGGVFQCSLDPA